MMNSRDTITVIPFSIVTLTRVAYVVGMVTLVTFTLDPTPYICISSPSVPMCSSLCHSNIEEFLVTQVNTTLCPGRARCPWISVLFSVTSLCVAAGVQLQQNVVNERDLTIILLFSSLPRHPKFMQVWKSNFKSGTGHAIGFPSPPYRN